MRHDLLADVFNIIKTTEAIGRMECAVPASNLTKEMLRIMKQHKYIEGFESVEGGRGDKFKVKLWGRINNCNTIRPNFYVKKNEFIKWEKRFLPANNLGILILTTPKGVMDQKEAEKEGTGGRLLGYVY